MGQGHKRGDGGGDLIIRYCKNLSGANSKYFGAKEEGAFLEGPTGATSNPHNTHQLR